MHIQTPSQLLTEAIAGGATPGAILLAGTSDRILQEHALGRMSYDEVAPAVTANTIYDLASLTKVIVTTTLAMVLYERGQLDLEAPVSTYVAEFSGPEKDDVSIEDLLAHRGGLLWWTDLYRRVEGRSPEEAKRRYVDEICSLSLDYAPRTKTVYSDLGFLLLGVALERLTTTPLDQLATREIFEPLGMTETRYNPPETDHPRIAPTEDDAWRGTVLRGVVHDENAYGLGGVGPHAGLFSTARGLVPFARLFLNAGSRNVHWLFSADTVRRFTTRADSTSGSSRALGWDTPAEGSSAGTKLSQAAFGHTGFTGTSLWIDPEQDLFAILLTNRVHPTRENPKLAAVRPRIHDALISSLRVG